MADLEHFQEDIEADPKKFVIKILENAGDRKAEIEYIISQGTFIHDQLPIATNLSRFLMDLYDLFEELDTEDTSRGLIAEQKRYLKELKEELIQISVHLNDLVHREEGFQNSEEVKGWNRLRRFFANKKAEIAKQFLNNNIQFIRGGSVQLPHTDELFSLPVLYSGHIVKIDGLLGEPTPEQ